MLTPFNMKIWNLRAPVTDQTPTQATVPSDPSLLLTLIEKQSYRPIPFQFLEAEYRNGLGSNLVDVKTEHFRHTKIITRRT